MQICPLCARAFDDEARFCPYDGGALGGPPGPVGAVVDEKYRIERELGSGGMATVYRAAQLRLERPVALKVIRGDFVENPSFQERFKREALTVARLKHPNIVTIHDFGVDPAIGAYIVMELLEGRSLRSELSLRGRLSRDEAVPIARQVAAALTAAQTAGVIHRDLKPDNVFL